MKKTLLLALLLAGYAGVAMGQLQRTSATEYDGRTPVAAKTPALARGSKAAEAATSLPARISATKTVKAYRSPVARAAAKGSLEGFCTYPMASRGWYSFNAQGRPSKDWSADIPSGTATPSAGFVADGVLYTFWRATDYNYNLTGMGFVKYDYASGRVLDQVAYDLFGGYDKVVFGAAYNEDEGCAYLLCGQKDNVNRFSMQKFNLATGAFTLVANLSGDDYPMAYAWYPRNGGIYLIDEGGRLMRYNDATASFKSVKQTSIDVGYAGGMVYSAKDEAFIVLMEGEECATTFYKVDPVTATTTTLMDLGDDSQWNILYCADSNSDTAAPGALSGVSVSFSGASLSGTLTATLPAVTIDGGALSGDVYVRVSETGNVLSESVKGAPGATVSVPLTLTEGAHSLQVMAYVKNGDKSLVGPRTTVNVTVGNDTPTAPGSVTLTDTQVTWSPSVAANGGYMDAAALGYNVYIDGKKVNDQSVKTTSLAVTLPTTGNVAHIAAVEAVLGSYTSDRALSNVVVGQQPFGLPCYIRPLDGQTDLDPMVQVLLPALNANGDNRTWIYDQQSGTGGFYYLCSVDNDADDWLVMPQMKFDRPGYYKFSFEVNSGLNHFFAGDEVFEIGIARQAYAPDLKAGVFTEPVTVKKSAYFEPHEVVFEIKEAGNYHIGIHCITPVNIFRLYARNFAVEALQATEAAPAAVTGLNAAAAAKGALQAIVTFNMPSVDIDGMTLAADLALTATVVCGENTATVTGLPGQAMTATVDALQGDNTVSVRVSSAKGGEGPAASVVVTVGVDTPDVLTLYKNIAADNMSMRVSWTVSTKGAFGGYVDPAGVGYIVYRKHENGNYVQYEILDKGVSEWNFALPAGTAQDIYQFGILPYNEAGALDQFAVVEVMLGKLYELPMKETFRTAGENVVWTYDPIGIQNVAEQYCSWGFADPADIEDGAPNDSKTALVSIYQGVGQLSFPRFSTVGLDNVKISLSMLHGVLSSTEVIIAAVTPDANFFPIEVVDLTEGTGWQNTSVTLPEACLGKGWAGLVVRCTNPTFKHRFVMDGYEVKAYTNAGINLLDVQAQGSVRVGKEAKVSAVIANMTTSNVGVPAINAVFTAENGTTAALIPADDYSDVIIGRGERTTIEYYLPATADHLGYGNVRLVFADPSIADESAEGFARVRVVKGYTPFISTLSAESRAAGASLSWDPVELPSSVTEGAEDLQPWDFGDNLGDFLNIDNDRQSPYSISEVVYPGKYTPKAFQVFAGSEFAIPVLQAHKGDQYFMIFSPDSKATLQGNDWLVSPRVAGGSEVSAYICAPSLEYGEESVTLEISGKSADPADFEVLTTFTADATSWKYVSATLPADARYFALHYTGYGKFCMMIDDITFSPYDIDGAVEAYNIYRDGALIGTSATASYTDAQAPESAVYNVAPVIRHADGMTDEGIRSNSARIGLGGIASTVAGGAVAGGRGYIAITGFEGLSATVFTPDGSTVAAVDELPGTVRIPAAPGMYIVAVGSRAYKIIVK